MSDKARSLTPKQEAFAQLVVEIGSQAEAYRQAYNSKAKPESVQVEASKLANKPTVALRIQEIRDALAEANIWKKLDSLKVLVDITNSGEKDSDRVNAVKTLNSMYGWDKLKIEHSGTVSVTEKPLSERLSGGSKR